MLVRAIAWLSLIAVARAQAQLDGAVAPAGCWYTRGGSASRSGVALTPAIQGTPRVAWRYVADGEIESEPLVWKSQIVLAVRKKDGRRRIELIDLQSGHRVAASASFETECVLEPSLWGKRIVVRTARDTLESLSAVGPSLHSTWKHTSKSGVSNPLCFGAEIYVHADGGFTRMPFGRSKPLWKVDGLFGGDIALLGDRVMALQFDGAPSLSTFDRSSGVAHEVGIVAPNVDAIERREDSHVQPLADGRFLVQHGNEIVGTSGVATCSVLCAMGEPTTLIGIEPIAPVALGSDLLGFAKTTVKERLETVLATFDSSASGKLMVLATNEMHGEFTRPRVPLSVASGIAYLGASAFDVDTKRILFTLPIEARYRAVPVPEGMLLVEGSSALVHLSSATERRTKGTLLLDAASADADGRVLVRGATVVWRDGTLQRGAVQLTSSGEYTFAIGAATTSLDPVALVADAKGMIVYAAESDAAIEALRVVIEVEMAQRWTDLALDSGPARDALLMDRLISTARLHGSTDPRLDRAQETQEKLAKEAKSVDKARATTIEEKEKALSLVPAQILAERAKSLPRAAPVGLRAAMFGAALEDDPKCEEARRGLRAMLPSGLEHVDPAIATEVIDAFASAPMHAVNGKGEDADSKRLAAAKGKWRPDLVGVRSANLLIVAPVSRAGIAARCLQTGELVCRALNEIFPASNSAAAPLLLYLYETRDEYLSACGPSVARMALTQNSAGLYDLVENVTRIFLPTEKEALRRLLHTYAHELTHHWLSARWGNTGDNKRPRQDRMPGFWIVEGLATMVEEFPFDVSTGTFSTSSANAERIDIVAQLPRGLARLEWKGFFAMSQRELEESDMTAELAAVRARDHLGLLQVLTPPALYYNQAAAACHFLYNAENGAYRARLLAFAASWYAGKKDDVDVEKVFGISADSLGQKIEAWARAVSKPETR